MISPADIDTDDMIYDGIIGQSPAIRDVLDEIRMATRWVLSGPRGAAARLGINRSTLQFRMKKLGIERPAVSNEVTV